MRVLLTLTMLVVFGCSDDPTSPKQSLDTSVRESTGSTWAGTEGVTADKKWRNLSYDEATQRLLIAWEFTIHNSRTSTVNVSVSRLIFEDAAGLQITERQFYLGEQDFSVAAGGSRTRDGNTTRDVPSLSIANEISRLGIWASFTP